MELVCNDLFTSRLYDDTSMHVVATAVPDPKKLNRVISMLIYPVM